MPTAFGKYCRLLRIKNDEVLRGMAQKLGVSSSYLSAVENAKRPIPHSWRDKLVQQYALSDKEADELDRSIYESYQEIKMTIDLNKFSKSDRDMLIAFARRYDGLDDDAKTSLSALFKGLLEMTITRQLLSWFFICIACIILSS